jgi:hypothetical protein
LAAALFLQKFFSVSKNTQPEAYAKQLSIYVTPEFLENVKKVPPVGVTEGTPDLSISSAFVYDTGWLVAGKNAFV